MKTLTATAAVMTLAVLTLATACKHEKHAEASQAPVIDVAEVATDSVTIHKVYPGYLSADKAVDLVARVDGYLTATPVESGSFVKKGTVVYTIESSQYADQVRQAQASLENAQSTYEYNKTHYSAMLKALESDAVSQMEVLQAKNAMESAQASIASAKAALQTAQTTLSYCTVRAPFDGHITGCDFSVGAFLAGAGSPVKLGTIYDDSSVTANFAIDDNQLHEFENINNNPALSADMKRIPLEFEVNLPHKYTADLSYIAPAIDKSTGSMQIQAKIQNPYGELRSGMYCKIQMPQAVLSKAMLVKEASIATDQLGKYIYVVNDSNRVVYTPIEVGELVNDTLRIVTKGVKPGDKYVTKALLKVRDGLTVEPRLTK